MAATTRRSSRPVLRSLSPSGRLLGASSSAFASSSSSFSSRFPVSFRHRPSGTSPTRLSLTPQSSSLRFSFDRPISPSRSISVASRNQPTRKHHGSAMKAPPGQKRTCMCSPTTHPGSFRCSLHKNSTSSRSFPSNRLNARRSAMTNSLVRIGTVEGDLVKRALASLIRPSSHQVRRRCAFEPRPSRLSVMSRAEDC